MRVPRTSLTQTGASPALGLLKAPRAAGGAVQELLAGPLRARAACARVVRGNLIATVCGRKVDSIYTGGNLPLNVAIRFAQSQSTKPHLSDTDRCELCFGIAEASKSWWWGRPRAAGGAAARALRAHALRAGI